MEAVPRLPMLKVEMKELQDYSANDWMEGVTDETMHEAIKNEINKHIRDNYSDDPKKYKDCIDTFLDLQSSAHRVMHSPDMEGCNTLKKYYGQLHYMQSRFPFIGENALNVPFAWSDAFTGKYNQYNSFVFEQSSILFNLGAIHSYLGSVDSRASDEGTKISCVHFQCAAGFFQFLANHIDTTLSPDTSQFMLKLYINTMLGQGQECLLEKSMQDNRKNSIIAKIAQQVVEYYEQSLNSLNHSDAKQAMGDANKLWQRLLSFKVAFYTAIVKYYLGNDDWEQEKYGTGLSYFGAAKDAYNESVKLSRNLKGDIRSRADEALNYSADVFSGRFNSAKKDNEFVYHEKVPDPGTLATVKGASLVKALPFDPSNSAVSGPDIFAKLVPLEAHLTASTYSEEKAKLLRPIVSEVEDKNDVLEQYKRAIELDSDKLIKIDDEDRLDPLLIEHCAALSVDQTPIQDLTKAMKELSNVYMDIDSLMNETISLMEDEEKETVQVKEICGKTVDSSNEVSKLKKELETCKEVHEKAAQMNDDVHTAMKVHIANLKVVSEGLDMLKKECNLASISELITDEDTEVITSMEKLCSKVSEMETQRHTLVAQLRSQLEDDDVTSALMTNPGIDAEDLFKEELKKHDTVLGYIKQNLAAQENILNAVTEANVRYAKIKKVVDAHKNKVKSKCDNFLYSCSDYAAAVKRCEEGTLFFKELHERVKDVLEKMAKLNEKNSKLRKIIIDKHKVNKPPPRPSAPKPKSMTSKPPPGTSMFSADELASMAAEDMEEFNDPAFLKFLKMSGGLPSDMTPPVGNPHGGVPTSFPHRGLPRNAGPLPPGPVLNNPQSRFNSPTSMPHSLPHNIQPQHPNMEMGTAHPTSRGEMQHQALPCLESQGLQPQFTTLGQQPIMSSQQMPPPASPHPHQPVGTQHGGSYNARSAVNQQSVPQSQGAYQPPPSSQFDGSHQQMQQATQAYAQLPQQPANAHTQVQPHGHPTTQSFSQSGQQVGPTSTQQNYNEPVQYHSNSQHMSQQANQHQVSGPQHGYESRGYPANQPHLPYSGSSQAPAVSQPALHSHPGHYPHPRQHPHTAIETSSQYSKPADTRTTLPQNYYQQQLPHMSQPQRPFNANPMIHQPTSFNQMQRPPMVNQPPPPTNHMMQQPTAANQMQRFSMANQPSQTNQMAQQANQMQRPYMNNQMPSQPPPQANQMPRQPPPQANQMPRQPPPQANQMPRQPPPQANQMPRQPPPQANQMPRQPPPQANQMPRQAPPQANQMPRQAPPQANQMPRSPLPTNQFPQQPSVQQQQQHSMSRYLQPNQQYNHPQQYSSSSTVSQGHMHNSASPVSQYQEAANRQQASTHPPSNQQSIPPQNYHTRMPHQQGPVAPPHQQTFQSNQPPVSQQSSPLVGAQQPGLQAQNFRAPVGPPASQAQYYQHPANANAPASQQQFNQAQQQTMTSQQQNTIATPSHPMHQRTPAPQLPAQKQSNVQLSMQSSPRTTAPDQALQKTAANMAQPMTPTVIGGKAVTSSSSWDSAKPSADLEGLTYVPTGPVRLPSSTNDQLADDLLSSNIEVDTPVVRESKSLLLPTKVDREDMVVTRIDDLPYDNEANLMKFKSDVESFQRRVSTLLVKAQGSLCQLDKDWKQLSELQEKSSRQQSTAVGRCSSYKNRFQDILPFDQNRVILAETKDDYINASMVDGINKYSPRFIAAQSPLASSCCEFWTMIHEQQVTLVVMLVKDNEIPKKCAKYWPEDRNVATKHGALSITFTTSRNHGSYVERTFTLKHSKSSLPRSLTQLQYIAWPEHGHLSSMSDLLSFIDVVHNFHSQQRSLQWPIVVHCENGVNHTGTFCSAYACIKHVDAGLGIPDVLDVVDKMRTKRKYMLQEKTQLKFVYDLVNTRSIELLKQRGVTIHNQPPSHAPSQNNVVTSPKHNNAFDVFDSGAALASIKASVDKLTVKNQLPSQPSTLASNASSTSQAIDPSPASSATGNNVIDLVQDISPVSFPAGPAISYDKPDVISDCKEMENTANLAAARSDFNQSHIQVEQRTSANVSDSSIASGNAANSILDQLTPESFTLGSDVKEKKRITKADFFKSKTTVESNASDPFADLDPLSGFKK